MAEMVGSAVVEATLKQAVAGLIGTQEEAAEVPGDGEQHVERLEMAQLRMEAVIEVSRKWRIQDASLLRWRRKLKRAAQECRVALRDRKQRAVQEDEAKEREQASSFPRRVARAATSLAAALFGGGRLDDAPAAAVRRFEWFADGAGEFLRFVELGGTPLRCAVHVDPLIGRLLAGEELRYRFVRRSQYHLFCVRPISLDGRGVEAKLLFVYEDDDAPERNLCLGSIMRLSESTDVIGTVARCLELLGTPHFGSTAASARRELASLPRQDFSWVPYLDSGDKEHWNAMHTSLTQWFRPNPLCCKGHAGELKKPPGAASSSMTAKLSDVSDQLEPIIEVFLQRHIPLSEYNMHRTRAGTVEEVAGATCLKNVPHLKLGLLFSPHGSSEEMTLAPATAESAVVEVIDGEEQQGSAVNRNISLEQLDEFMLPKAIDCLHRKPEATAYQMFWKSCHGTAFLQVQNTGMVKAPPRRRATGSRREMIRRRRDPKLERWIQVVIDFLNLWVAHAPRRLQGSFVEWVQKANEMQN